MDLVEVDFNIKIRHPWELARLKVVKSILKNNTSNVKSILDVGSGDAFVADELSKEFNNSNVYCIDIEYLEVMIYKINKKFKNPKLHLFSSLEDIPELGNITAVTLLDVIEHVPNDVELIKSILNSKGIGKNTKFLITVPAYQKLFTKHDIALKHYRRYNLKTLNKTICESGLSVEKQGYFFTTLLFPRIIQLIKEKTLKKTSKELENLGTWNKGWLITNVIVSILYFDYCFGRFISKLGINLPGLSCYAICSLK